MAVQPVRKAVLPVAGLGTRFLPATKAIPKEMLTIVDRPAIQYVVEEALEAGIEEIIFVTGRGKSAIEDHFDFAYELETTLAERGKTDRLKAIESTVPTAGNFVFTRQQKPLGLGHAIWCARHMVGREPFAILLPDMLVDAKPSCLKQMMDLYAETGGNVIGLEEVPREETHKYGIVAPGAVEGARVEVTGLVEKPDPKEAPSTYYVMGRYILHPELFDHLETQEPGAGGEIQLTDSLVKLIGDKPFHGLLYDGKVYDCGDRLGFLQANMAFALARDDVAGALRPWLKDVL